jgi:kumamolisin
MAAATRRTRAALPGSKKKPMAGARSVGKADNRERIEVTIRIKRRSLPAVAKPRVASLTRKPLTRAQFREFMAADPADILAVERFAHDQGLDVVRSSVTQRSVRVAGTVAAMAAAFGVRLKSYRAGRATYRIRSGAVYLPKGLCKIVEAVIGLDNRPLARPHFRLLQNGKRAVGRRSPRRKPRQAAGPRPLKPTEVAALYQFPTQVDGDGQCIAIIELGGGYRLADLRHYFEALDIDMPKVVAISVLGAGNQPTGEPGGPDGEVMLDIEVAGAVAPGARIAVYFAPNTDQGFLTALSTAIHDSVHNPSVISISWGAPEKDWTEQAMAAFDSACNDATLLGITVCCAAGDNGSSDTDPPGRRANVDFPSSSPHVLACGGTRLIGDDGQIAAELVWNNPGHGATGGGVSETFALPDYQKSARVPKSVNPGHKRGRGVPDIAGNADPASGYIVRVDGTDMVIGGTSAVAPLWAGLIALMNQSLEAKRRPVGFLTPKLYDLAAAASAFRDITSGDNGAYRANAGWDPCTGLGSPNGKALVKAL